MISKDWKSILLHVLIASVYILVRIGIVARPTVASAVLTLMLAIKIILVGILRVIAAIQHRGLKNWGWPLLSGIFYIFFGLVMAARWPVSGLIVMGLFVAIELIIYGWSYVFIALAARNARDLAPSES